MKFIIMLVFVALVVPVRNAHCQELEQKRDFVMRAGFVTLAGFTAADVDATRYAIEHGAHEKNRMYHWAENKPGALGFAIGSTSALTGIAAYQLHKNGHEKLARVFLWTMNGIKGGVVAWNYRQGREAARRR